MSNKNVTAVILAAGQGTRLRPMTDSRPKCMVEVDGKPILQWQIGMLQAAGVEEIIVVTGYQQEVIPGDGIRKIYNPEFATTNMIESLFCAEEQLKGELIISYGDIITTEKVIRELLSNPGDIVIAADEKWHDYWSERFEDPLSDAESFVKADDGKVASLGQKTSDFSQIQSQYIGLIKLNAHGCDRIKEVYHEAKASSSAEVNAWFSGRPLRQAYMTDLLNHIAGNGDLYYQPVQRGWVEIDDPHDLEIAEKIIKNSQQGFKINKSGRFNNRG